MKLVVDGNTVDIKLDIDNALFAAGNFDPSAYIVKEGQDEVYALSKCRIGNINSFGTTCNRVYADGSLGLQIIFESDVEVNRDFLMNTLGKEVSLLAKYEPIIKAQLEEALLVVNSAFDNLEVK